MLSGSYIKHTFSETLYGRDEMIVCRWYVADGRADGLEEASTSGRELRGGAARIGRPEELFGSSQKRKRPARHRVIMLRGVVRLIKGALLW